MLGATFVANCGLIAADSDMVIG